jgi:hypothetical protein
MGCTKHKGKGREGEGVLVFFKRDSNKEFKYKFEFNPSKIVHQHACNKHQAIYLI